MIKKILIVFAFVFFACNNSVQEVVFFKLLFDFDYFFCNLVFQIIKPFYGRVYVALYEQTTFWN